MQTGVQTKHTGGALAAQFTSWMDASALAQVVRRRWFHFHQLKASCTVWLVVVAMEFSFEAVCSFLRLEKLNTISSLTIQRQDSWFQGKELDESDICRESFFGCNQKSWMAVLLFIKYQPCGISAMLERRAYHVQGYSSYFVGLVWLMLKQPNLWEWMSTTMWQNKKPTRRRSQSWQRWWERSHYFLQCKAFGLWLQRVLRWMNNAPAWTLTRSSARSTLECGWWFSFCWFYGFFLHTWHGLHGEKCKRTSTRTHRSWTRQSGTSTTAGLRLQTRTITLPNKLPESMDFTINSWCLMDVLQKQAMRRRWVTTSWLDFTIQLWNWVDSCVFHLESSQAIWNQERANLVAFNAMGAGQYLNLVRQRAYVEGGETTDVQMSGNQNTEETEESENATDDEVTAARPLQDPSMTDLMEELKIEFRLAQQRNEPNDAVRIQRIMMQMLNDIRNGVTNEMVENYNRRIADLFFQMSETARSQNRLQSSLYYGRRCAHFRGDAWELNGFFVVNIQQNTAGCALEFYKNGRRHWESKVCTVPRRSANHFWLHFMPGWHAQIMWEV